MSKLSAKIRVRQSIEDGVLENFVSVIDLIDFFSLQSEKDSNEVNEFSKFIAMQLTQLNYYYLNAE